MFNHGKMRRDFTYIDDIVEGVVRVMGRDCRKPNPNWSGDDPDPGTPTPPTEFTISATINPVELTDFIETIEERHR